MTSPTIISRRHVIPPNQRGGDIARGGSVATLTITWPTTEEGWKRWRHRRARWRLAICNWAQQQGSVDFHPKREAIRLVRLAGLDLATEEKLIADNRKPAKHPQRKGNRHG